MGIYAIKNSPLVAGDISNGSSFLTSDGDETELLVLEQDVQSDLGTITDADHLDKLVEYTAINESSAETKDI